MPVPDRALRQQQRQERLQNRPPQREQAQPAQPRPEQRQQRRQERQLERQQAQPTPRVQPAQPIPQTVQRQPRQERVRQGSEDRAAGAAAQRTQQREETSRTRQERVRQRQQAQPNAAALAAQPRAAESRSAARRDRAQRTTPLLAREGRFAAPFAAARVQRAEARNRPARTAARRAWRQGHRATFVAWYGPVFWPYAYSDIFDYAFWPGGYETGYWAYAYDDFFDGVFWGEVGPPQEYADATPTGAAPQPTVTAVRNLCNEPGSGITAWPFAEIEKKVGLDGEQRQLLGDVRDAATEAAATFKASCPPEQAAALTPPGRLDVMMARLGATLDAVQTVRPVLSTFYDALSDEQKERFNAIGPDKAASTEAREALPDEAKRCGEAKPGLTNLPIEQIEDALKPTEAQLAELDRLGEATVTAVGILQEACPTETPITPPGRLEAMEKRLNAMLEAAETVKPALASFYGSLSNEQKARFNRLGRELASKD